LIAPHHGSKTSSTPKFIDSVADPETVIFCAGWDNRFRLPNEQVVNRYQQKISKYSEPTITALLQIRTNGVSTKITPFLK
jgi:competence protein ComEC